MNTSESMFPIISRDKSFFFNSHLLSPKRKAWFYVSKNIWEEWSPTLSGTTCNELFSPSTDSFVHIYSGAARVSGSIKQCVCCLCFPAGWRRVLVDAESSLFALKKKKRVNDRFSCPFALENLTFCLSDKLVQGAESVVPLDPGKCWPLVRIMVKICQYRSTAKHGQGSVVDKVCRRPSPSRLTSWHIWLKSRRPFSVFCWRP